MAISLRHALVPVGLTRMPLGHIQHVPRRQLSRPARPESRQLLPGGGDRLRLSLRHPLLPRRRPLVLRVGDTEPDRSGGEELRHGEDPLLAWGAVEGHEVVRHGPLQVGVPRLAAQGLQAVGAPEVDVRDVAVEEAVDAPTALDLRPSASGKVDATGHGVELEGQAAATVAEAHAVEGPARVLEEDRHWLRQRHGHLAEVPEVEDEHLAATADAQERHARGGEGLVVGAGHLDVQAELVELGPLRQLGGGFVDLAGVHDVQVGHAPEGVEAHVQVAAHCGPRRKRPATPRERQRDLQERAHRHADASGRHRKSG
mmetsp:Transcript_126556/g.354366  ORF Transcript_126556/g.354366 Transcript_126556/m.354366 type:complete len:314 (+) Transcript_126556:310-1251(+)